MHGGKPQIPLHLLQFECRKIGFYTIKFSEFVSIPIPYNHSYNNLLEIKSNVSLFVKNKAQDKLLNDKLYKNHLFAWDDGNMILYKQLRRLRVSYVHSIIECSDKTTWSKDDYNVYECRMVCICTNIFAILKLNFTWRRFYSSVTI